MAAKAMLPRSNRRLNSLRRKKSNDETRRKGRGPISLLFTGVLSLVTVLLFAKFYEHWNNPSLGYYNPISTAQLLSTAQPSQPHPPTDVWDFRREKVKDAFVASWDAYVKDAWGYDRYHPVSRTGSQMSPQGLGWMIVDSLDTMMIMNLTSRVSDARAWISNRLDYNQDQDVNTFETTIRMLGGFLSAHHLSATLSGQKQRADGVYLKKAIDLARRVLPAFDSPSGIPYSSVWLSSGKGLASHSDGGASSTAEATTVQLELKYLSELTGDSVYWKKAERVMQAVDDNQSPDGLVPIFVHPASGKFVTPEIRLGSRGDSYYEYLIKQYLQTGKRETIYSDMWQQALAGIEKHMLMQTKQSKLWFPAELPVGVRGSRSPKMDHLVCFLPGTIALGATEGLTEREARRLPTWTPRKGQEMQMARELMKTCWAMYAVTATGIAPEIVYFQTNETQLGSGSRAQPLTSSEPLEDSGSWKADLKIKPLDAHNLQRPETVESLFVMWRITGDPIHREWGWQIFEAFRRHSRVKGTGAYTSLADVRSTPTAKRDNMESFWLAETLKYLYLLFSPAGLLPLNEVVFNTEGHVFPILKQGQFQTGWYRKRRVGS